MKRKMVKKAFELDKKYISYTLNEKLPSKNHYIFYVQNANNEFSCLQHGLCLDFFVVKI